MASDVGRPKGPAIWRWGFIIGGCAGALGIVAAIATLALTAGVSLLLDGVCILLVLALYFVGGLFVARQTTSVGAATLSGAVAGIFSAILREIAAVFVTYSQPLPPATVSGLSEGTLRTIAVVISLIFVLLIFGGLGAGLAALGGLAGRPRYTNPFPMMYPGVPGFAPPGYPMPQGYAPPPGYPMPQGYGLPPGYPMPQGFGPPPGYAAPGYPPPSYPTPGYPAAGWYPPAPGVPAYPPPASPSPPVAYPTTAAADTAGDGEAPAEPEVVTPAQTVTPRLERTEEPAYQPLPPVQQPE